MAKRSDISITVEEVPGRCSNNLFGSGDCNENVVRQEDDSSKWKCSNCSGGTGENILGKLKIYNQEND